MSGSCGRPPPPPSRVLCVTRARRVRSYGPFEDVWALSSLPVRVHFETGAVFATFTSALREVDVSAWSGMVVRARAPHPGGVVGWGGM